MRFRPGLWQRTVVVAIAGATAAPARTPSNLDVPEPRGVVGVGLDLWPSSEALIGANAIRRSGPINTLAAVTRI